MTKLRSEILKRGWWLICCGALMANIIQELGQGMLAAISLRPHL